MFNYEKFEFSIVSLYLPLESIISDVLIRSEFGCWTSSVAMTTSLRMIHAKDVAGSAARWLNNSANVSEAKSIRLCVDFYKPSA